MKKYLTLIFIIWICIGIFFVFKTKEENTKTFPWWTSINQSSINNDYKWGLEPPKNLWKYKNVKSDYQWWLLPPQNLWKLSHTGVLYQGWFFPPIKTGK